MPKYEFILEYWQPEGSASIRRNKQKEKLFVITSERKAYFFEKFLKLLVKILNLGNKSIWDINRNHYKYVFAMSKVKVGKYGSVE